MKKKLIALILAAMSITALAACGKKEQKPSGDDTPVDPGTDPGTDPGGDTPEALPAEYSLMDYWEGNEQEEAYAVAKQGENTVITYTDVTGEYAGGWEYVKRSFQYDTRAAEFGVYKKILFKGKLEKTSGSDIVMIKVEGTDGNQYEKRFQFSSEVKTYELGLSFISDWTKVSQILFFANRLMNESGSGKITLEKFVLSQEAVVPENDIDPNQPAVPQGYALYNQHVGADGKVDVMYHWGYSSDGNVATAEADGKYTFTWGNSKGEWEYVSSKIKDGEAKLAESGLKRIVFEVTGTAGHKATLKLECEQGGAVEKHIDLTGEKQEFELDVTGLLIAEKTSFKALIFPDGGVAEPGEAQLVLSACYLDKTEVFVPDPEYMNYANYQSLYLDKFKAEPEGVTIVNENHISTFTFENLAPSWAGVEYIGKLHSDIAWANINDYSHFHAVFKASSAMKIMFKAFNDGALERVLELPADTEVPVDLDIPTEKLNFANPSVLFVNPALDGAVAVTGTLTVKYMQFARAGANIYDGEKVEFKNYSNASQGAYTLSKNDDQQIVVDYTRTAPDWSGMELFFTGHDFANYNKVVGVINSTVDTEIKIKPFEANEQTIVLKAGDNNILFSFTAKNADDMWGKLIIIAAYEGQPLTGKLTIKSLVMSHADPMTQPKGLFYKPVELGTGVGGGVAPLFIEIGDDTASVRLDHTNTDYQINLEDADIKSFDAIIGKLVIDAGEKGDITMMYDPSTNKLTNIALPGTAAALLKLNGYQDLASNFKYWNCDGTTSELQAQFVRRYGNPWKLDGPGGDANNADRFTQDTANYRSGSAMKVRAYSSDRIAIATPIWEEAFTAHNVSFWVYNSGSSEVSLQIFGYTTKSYTGANTTIAGTFKIQPGWNYVQKGCNDVDIYAFQIFVAATANVLTFDDIVLL